MRLRERWFRRGKQPVYIDECGFEPSVTRRYGYAKGQRGYGLRCGKRTPRTSLIAARIGGRLQEPFLFEGPGDADVFNVWRQRRLCPRLNGDPLVIMDNAAFHKAAKTIRLIEQTGATLLFLPPYSPDLNPIEHDFAALKKNSEYNQTASIDDIINTYK